MKKHQLSKNPLLCITIFDVFPFINSLEKPQKMLYYLTKYENFYQDLNQWAILYIQMLAYNDGRKMFIIMKTERAKGLTCNFRFVTFVTEVFIILPSGCVYISRVRRSYVRTRGGRSRESSKYISKM